MAQIKDLNRMCAFYEDCTECKCRYNEYGRCKVCFLPDNLDEIVDEWVKEHPAKTYAMDFFEKFPNARKNDSGIPNICVKHLYGNLYMKCCNSCGDCWNQEMEENA